MKIRIENDRLIVYEHNDNIIRIYLDVNALELARALKPYLDSIPNHTCKECKNKWNLKIM